MPSLVVDRYQRAFADWLGTGRAFGFWKGRVALYAILKGLGLNPGDEVIVPGYTCVMAVNPIVYLGAKLVFVDIEPATYNINPELIERAITPRTRIIIAQHTYGYPAAMDAIMDIANRKGLRVVEDCCLALGSAYRGRRVGTFGDAAYFSFQWNKPYTSGLGGMAVVRQPEVADRIESICSKELVPPTPREVAMLRAQFAVYRTLVYPSTTALMQTAFRFLTRTGLVVGSSSSAEFEPRQADDFFKGMSSFQARVGFRRMRKIDPMIQHRKRMTTLYDQLLAEHSWPIPPIASECDPVLVRYPVRVSDKQCALTMAAPSFVELGSWFECPLHPIETPMEMYGYHTGMCPEADRASRETVNLPLHPRVSVNTVRKSVEFIVKIGPAGTFASR